MKKILFITNGHGEDLVAAELIKRLKAPDFDLAVLPLVGEGKAFEALKVKIIGPRKNLPSGGFSLRNLFYLAQDLYAGLIGNTLEQINILRQLRRSFDLTVAIGDIVPIIGALIVKSPFIFIGVNKSSYYQWFGFNYTPWEKLLLQRYALKVFVRDKITEQSLKNRGIKVPLAEYAGNPLMDCVGKMTNDEFRMTTKKEIIIGLLPGTREDAKLNLEDFEKIAEEIVAMKGTDIELKFVAATTLLDIPAHIKNKPFPEVLADADLIIGLSGTGNEQAAGSGIPVVSFYGRGSQYNKKFARAQKQLLGEALLLAPESDPIAVAAEVWSLLRKPAKMEEMGKIGKERMGEGGAIKKIIDYIKAL